MLLQRFGVPLDAHDHQLPDISKSEFYDLGKCTLLPLMTVVVVLIYTYSASLCEVDFSARFLEFGWTREKDNI